MTDIKYGVSFDDVCLARFREEPMIERVAVARLYFLVVVALGVVTWRPTANAAEILSVTERSQNCKISIIGVVEPGDELKFQRRIAEEFKNGCVWPHVYIYSPGGDLDTALKIGRQIHLLQARTIAPELDRQFVTKTPLPRDGRRSCPQIPGEKERIAKEVEKHRRYLELLKHAWQNKLPAPRDPTQFWTFDPMTEVGDARCVCASACFFIWAAGAERSGDVIQIHRPFFEPNAYAQLGMSEARTAYQMVMQDARSFLREVDIPESIISRLFNTVSTKASYLTSEELTALEIAPYLEELKIARCGLETKPEDLPPNLTPAMCGLGKGRSEKYPHLSLERRCLLVKRLRRELCWQNAQQELRQTINTEYRRRYGQ